jgi:PKD repeat protein
MKRFLVILFGLLVVQSDVSSQCIADFTFSTSPSSLTVNFTDQSSFPPGTDHFWDFNDNFASSTLLNPSHTFSQAGTYLVYLSIFDSLNTCFDSTSYYVTVPGTAPIQCEADFYFNNPPGLSVQFFDSSTVRPGVQVSHFWVFGDDTASSNQLNPTYTYSAPGTYRVIKGIVDSLYTCVDTTSKYVTVIPTQCTADFSYSYRQQGPNTLVDFVNLSSNYTSNSIFTYRFGDGDTISIPANSANIDTQKTYSPGTYIVSLELQDTSINLFCSKSDTLVIPNRATCRADFSYQTIGDSVYFTNLARDYTNIKYFFGDGDSSILSDPIHTYAQSNSYTVSQIVFDSLTACTDTAIQNINVTVSTSCIARYVPAIDTSKKQLLYLINQSSDLNTHQYFWDFGDGNTANGKTPIHNYANYGAYSICLTVSDSSLNCMNHFCDTIGLDSNNQVINKSGGFTLQVLDGGSIGVEERDEMDQVKVYPNPVRNRLSIELPLGTECLRFQLYSLQGKLLKEGEINQSDPHIGFDQFNKGVYLLNLSFQNHFKQIKVLKME